MWVLFAAVGYLLISPELIFYWDMFEWTRMLFFISIMFLTVIYVFYDILYLEIPESILIWWNILALWALIAQDMWYNFIPYIPTLGVNIMTLWVCLIVLVSLYIIMLAGLKERYDSLIVIWCIWLLWWYMYLTGSHFTDSALLSGTLAALVIFISFFLQIVLSWWKWMWAGDLRIAILMWLLVWVSFAFPAWMITYLVGSIIGIWLIISSKIKHGIKSDFNHQIPFGPFLAIWYLSILFFHPQISKFIELYF
jgi:prepilin signal peptidase PulO-like enzyme (type II secretory pathway)